MEIPRQLITLWAGLRRPLEPGCPGRRTALAHADPDRPGTLAAIASTRRSIAVPGGEATTPIVITDDNLAELGDGAVTDRHDLHHRRVRRCHSRTRRIQRLARNGAKRSSPRASAIARLEARRDADVRNSTVSSGASSTAEPSTGSPRPKQTAGNRRRHRECEGTALHHHPRSEKGGSAAGMVQLILNFEFLDFEFSSQGFDIRPRCDVRCHSKLRT